MIQKVAPKNQNHTSWFKDSVLIKFVNPRPSAVKPFKFFHIFDKILDNLPAMVIPQCGAILRHFFWWADKSFCALFNATNTAWVFDLTPTVADPCLTASIAYSIWWILPWGDHVAALESYWLRNILKNQNSFLNVSNAFGVIRIVMTSFSYFSFDTRLFNFFPSWSFNIFRFLSSFLWRRINFIFHSFIWVNRGGHRFGGHSRQCYLRSKKLIRKCSQMREPAKNNNNLSGLSSTIGYGVFGRNLNLLTPGTSKSWTTISPFNFSALSFFVATFDPVKM